MSSTLACVGFATDDLAGLEVLIERTLPEVVGHADGVDVVHFVDASGARLVVSVVEGETVDLMPSFAAPLGARLSGLVRQGDHVVADVVDERGGTLTRLSCELEQVRHLPEPRAEQAEQAPEPEAVDASVIALGVRVSVHADEAAFARSDDSLLGEPDGDAEPMRFAAESFLPYGLFGDDPDADPVAFLAGTVQRCETVENRTSGQVFHVAQVRCVGFTTSVCLAADEHPEAPSAGAVIAGACYLVVDAPSLWPAPEPRPRKRWFRK